MAILQFKAYAVTNEVDLNKIAVDFGIPKKYTWEEPLVLQGEILQSMLGRQTAEDQKILMFSFGSIVLINLNENDMPPLLEYIGRFENNIEASDWRNYTDDYELHAGNTDKLEINDTFAAVPQYEIFHAELAAIVLAKSVAMEKTEFQLGNILDKLEAIIDRLDQGKLRVGDKELARTTARVTRHQYNTINYIMILDKPDITWTNSDAALFYDKMSDLFELSDRYTVLTKKTDVLNNILGGFSSISHSMRGMFVEWVIVLLIVVEVILMAIDLLI